MSRPSVDDPKMRRRAAMTADEREVFDETYLTSRLALEVGQKSVKGAAPG